MPTVSAWLGMREALMISPAAAPVGNKEEALVTAAEMACAAAKAVAVAKAWRLRLRRAEVISRR